MSITVKVPNLDKLQQLTDAKQGLVSTELRKAIDGSGFIVESEAKRLAPVDRDQLRASITHTVDSDSPPKFVEIGTPVFYAPYMEYGTGLVHDHPNWPRNPHRLSPSVLAGWAGRHGLNEYAVAGAIMKRGGLRPRRFLRGALESKEQAVFKQFDNALDRIRAQWHN